MDHEYSFHMQNPRMRRADYSLYYVIIFKGREHPRILVSGVGGSWTNPCSYQGATVVIETIVRETWTRQFCHSEAVCRLKHLKTVGQDG